MEISFPKKSYFKEQEVLDILKINKKELRNQVAQGMNFFFSENGKKLYLREDVLVYYSRPEKENQKSKSLLTFEQQQLKDFQTQFNNVLATISKIKSSRSEIWYN